LVVEEQEASFAAAASAGKLTMTMLEFHSPSIEQFHERIISL